MRRRHRHCVSNDGICRRGGCGCLRWGKAVRSPDMAARRHRHRARHVSGQRFRSGAHRHACERLLRSYSALLHSAKCEVLPLSPQLQWSQAHNYSTCPGTISPSTMVGGTYCLPGSTPFGVAKPIKPRMSRISVPTSTHGHGPWVQYARSSLSTPSPTHRTPPAHERFANIAEVRAVGGSSGRR